MLAGCPEFPDSLLVAGDEAGSEASPPDDGGPRDGRRTDGALDGPRLPDAADAAADAPVDAPADGDGPTDAAGDAPPDTLPPDALPPDTLPPDAPPPDTLPPDTLPPDTVPPDTAPPPDTCTVSPAWWNASYAYRLPLTVTESISGSLAAGYSLRASLDTQALIAAGELLASGDDLRVVRHGASVTELDRYVVDIGGPSSAVWFKTQADVDGSDTSYFIYHGNPTAGAPPAHWADSMGADAVPSAVFLAGDDFTGHAAGDTPNGWEGSANYKVAIGAGSNPLLEVTGSDGPADYFFAGDLGWTDVEVSARMRPVDAAGSHYGLWVRADGTSDFRTIFFGLSDNDTLQVWNARISSPTATGLASSSMLRSWNISAAGTSWHRVAVRAIGSTLSYLFDDQERGTTSTSAQPQGRIGLCAGYPASHVRWDDFIVRRAVDPEPAVTPGSTENRCP